MTRRSAPLGLLVAVGLTLALAGCFTPPREVDVELDAGELQGVADDGVRSYRGIPYAAPPVGDLRWRPPQPVGSGSGVREADEFGDSCLQMEGSTTKAGTAEDCLFVNVFRPDTDADDLPVMVWVHGGSLNSGSGDLSLDMVSGLVEQGVVVVSFNYRLGRLGYFAHPALADEGGEAGPVANFGLLDQIAALQWVQDNIAEFGGNAKQVTIFGISSGGASVNYLMTSPLARGLFERAIAGSPAGREQPPTWEDAAAQGEDLIAGLGEPDADAATLRGLDADAIAGLGAFPLRNEIPILDRALPTSVSEAFSQGLEADVPYLVGTTDRELIDSNYVTFGLDPVVLRQQFVADDVPEALSAYGDTVEFDRHFLNDLLFTEPARYLARQHSSRAPTYLYRFSIAGDQAREQFGGAVHGADFPYVFGYGDGDPTVADAQDLADEVSACWVSFATTGVPACAAVAWPEAVDGAFLDFTNDGPEVVTGDPWQSRLDLVEAISKRFG